MLLILSGIEEVRDEFRNSPWAKDTPNYRKIHRKHQEQSEMGTRRCGGSGDGESRVPQRPPAGPRSIFALPHDLGQIPCPSRLIEGSPIHPQGLSDTSDDGPWAPPHPPFSLCLHGTTSVSSPNPLHSQGPPSGYQKAAWVIW